MDSFSPEVLLALQALLSKELASRGVASSVKEASVAPPKKAAKVSKEAKEASGEAKAKRAPGAWAAWTKHAPLAHAKEYAEFKASNVGAVGIAPLFCTQWRSAHAEEYAAFELAHKASASSAPSPASVPASAPAAAVPSPAKEGRKWSEEAKAKAALKRAATKAAKALAEAPAAAAAKEAVVSAAPPAPLPSAPPSAPSAPSNAAASNPFDEEEAEPELLPFKLGGRNYQRPGVSRLGAEPIWATGDLWEAKADGSRGDWAGVLEEDGSIDLDADEPSIF